uniref:Kazal-like domain-containing protein n=1 Tax=Strongyloides venezuelensis TaxID=75913 RepID=A0A0K0FBA4_STRVS
MPFACGPKSGYIDYKNNCAMNCESGSLPNMVENIIIMILTILLQCLWVYLKHKLPKNVRQKLRIKSTSPPSTSQRMMISSDKVAD